MPRLLSCGPSDCWCLWHCTSLASYAHLCLPQSTAPRSRFEAWQHSILCSDVLGVLCISMICRLCKFPCWSVFRLWAQWCNSAPRHSCLTRVFRARRLDAAPHVVWSHQRTCEPRAGRGASCVRGCEKSPQTAPALGALEEALRVEWGLHGQRKGWRKRWACSGWRG